MELVDAVLDDEFSTSQNDILDYQVRDFVENVYEKVSQKFSLNYVEELKESALKELLIHELLYMNALDEAQVLAEGIISKLSHSQMNRLMNTLKYLMSTNGIESIDYRTAHYPVLLTTIQTIIESEKPRWGQRYCPACGNITSSKKIQCEHCHTYLTIDKPITKLKRVINRMMKNFLKKSRKDDGNTSSLEHEGEKD